MSQGINGWKGRERLLWNSLSFLCPGWPPLCVPFVSRPSPLPPAIHWGVRGQEPFPARCHGHVRGLPAALPLSRWEEGGGLCRSRVFLLSRLRISDSIARSRSRSSFPQSTYNLLRIGMMSLPSRGCWGVWKGGVTTSGSRHSRWINEVQGGSRSEDDARLCRQADPSSHAVLPFAEWDFQWLQGRVCCSLLSL